MKYEILRREMQTGDCISWKGKGIASRIIQHFSEFSHSSLIIRFTEYSRDRVFVLEALNAGIVLMPLSQKLKHYNGTGYYQRLKTTKNKRYDIGDWALQHAGVKYDFSGLFKNIFGRVAMKQDHLFCSEFVYAAYSAAGLVDGIIAPRPGDLAKLKILSSPEKIDG